jgi:ElaB/YqjD/DUF883 family membrane-anchored ribosome-binding protein
MEKATSSTVFMPQEESEEKIKNEKPKLEDVSKKEVKEQSSLLVGNWPRRISTMLAESRHFVQKNPYTGILISTSVGVTIGLAFSAIIRGLKD